VLRWAAHYLTLHVDASLCVTELCRYYIAKEGETLSEKTSRQDGIIAFRTYVSTVFQLMGSVD
jgi:hypothetical protein